MCTTGADNNVIVHSVCDPATIPDGSAFYYAGLGVPDNSPVIPPVVEDQTGTIDFTTIAGLNYPIQNNIDALFGGTFCAGSLQ